MQAVYTFFRLIGLTLGYPAQLFFFKRRTFYEDKKHTHIHRGGKLIVSNHYNMLDYVMTHFVVYPRKLNVVTSEEPFRNKFFNWGMKFFGAIECNRETRSMRFMDKAAAVIRKGQLVQIFPEGRNTPDGKIHDFKRSYLVIAHRAKAPIIPVVTDGNYGPFRRASVIIGKEIDVSGFFTTDKPTPPREELDRANAYVYEHILALRAELEERKRKKRRNR